MGHGTEYHKEQNPGTGFNKGHNPDTEHEKDRSHCAKPHKENDHRADGHKEHWHENNNEDKSVEALVAENLMALSDTVASLGATIDMLVQKAASMAYHIIATEEILSEMAARTGLDLAQVNARIRAKIAVGTDNMGDANHAVDVAASIASQVPRR
ncbi:MAG: hypothetical protein PHY09_18050 [Desulfuromonadaceae bacterium]|nr:hypothetical protein [Desulfuromonadaceae bacterium]MDD5105452.1 hypothetical protein [Desulfuromonadaceae bacterium]